MIAPVNYNDKLFRFKITNPEDHLQKYWLKGIFYEWAMLEFIYRFRTYKKRPVIVDIGACIGNHTVFFAGVMKAFVYAFEPVKENLALLTENCMLNFIRELVFVIPHGAGQVRSKVKFEPDRTGNSGMGKISGSGSDIIQVIPVDEVISDSHEVDVLKIDVEGYNIPVLEGARQTIEHDHPEIYIECQTIAELQEVENFLLPLGYTRYPHPFNATPTYLFYH